MLLTISTTQQPATDLGYLLHKHPDRVQHFSTPTGTATVFYPQADAERCTAALLLAVDPIRLVRSRGRNAPDFALAQYVNDRPYAASSLLGAAMADVFRTARNGRCEARPELAQMPIPLRIVCPALPCRGGIAVLTKLFEPLGWHVSATPVPLDPQYPEWGDSRYLDVTLSGTLRLSDALNQLYVLFPVLDEAKHYWQSPDEVDKLLRSGSGWLADHPERELITRRYLGQRRGLTQVALARLAELAEEPDTEPTDTEPTETEPAADNVTKADSDEQPAPVPLRRLRHQAVLAALAELAPRTVIDLGCGSGDLLLQLVTMRSLDKIAGTDVSTRSLQLAARRLKLDRLNERQASRIELFQAALTYVDDRFANFDAAILMEVIEHIDPSRLAALEHVIFGTARPGSVVVTTPNSDYNVLYPDLVGFRHSDHRFEWSRAEFAEWCTGVAERHGYQVRFSGIGEPDSELGSSTQMATFVKQTEPQDNCDQASSIQAMGSS